MFRVNDSKSLNTDTSIVDDQHTELFHTLTNLVTTCLVSSVNLNEVRSKVPLNVHTHTPYPKKRHQKKLNIRWKYTDYRAVYNRFSLYFIKNTSHSLQSSKCQ